MKRWKRKARAEVDISKQMEGLPYLTVTIRSANQWGDVETDRQFSLDLGTAQQLAQEIEARLNEIETDPVANAGPAQW